jgi:hypothetical protein
MIDRNSIGGLAVLYVGMLGFVKHWLFMDSKEAEPFSCMLIADWFHVIEYVKLGIIVRHLRSKFQNNKNYSYINV